eukprot:3148825-Rhodomonas_salina.2
MKCDNPQFPHNVEGRTFLVDYAASLGSTSDTTESRRDNHCIGSGCPRMGVAAQRNLSPLHEIYLRSDAVLLSTAALARG